MAAFYYFFIIFFIKLSYFTCATLFDEKRNNGDVLLFDLSGDDCATVNAYDIEPEREDESNAEIDDIISFHKKTTGFS